MEWRRDFKTKNNVRILIINHPKFLVMFLKTYFKEKILKEEDWQCNKIGCLKCPRYKA